MRFLSVLPIVFIVACAWDKAPPPPPGQICSETEVFCATQLSCCYQGSTCGGEPNSVGCPAGQCCDIDNSTMMVTRDSGLHSRPQRKP